MRSEIMKIGYIDYLNCYPFYYHMFEKKSVPDIEIVSGYPGELNRFMRDGELDMSPISSAAYCDIKDNVFILPDFCLSSIGYVRSVVLYSRVPIEELNGKKVGLTIASETSVVLLKILLSKYYNVQPEYIKRGPGPDLNDVDAALIIGNEAMLESKDPIEYEYDLGDLWLRKTGHPVVFAVFAVQKKVLDKKYDLIKNVIESYRNSLNELQFNEDELVKCASLKYPAIKYDIKLYYSLLKFDFTNELKDSLMFYYDQAASLGLLKGVNGIQFME